MKNKICVKLKKLSTSPIIKDLFDKTNTICVTGQMASGKNFVCSELEKMGWTSVDADCLVHKAIDNSTEEIVQAFLPYTTQAKLQILNNDNKIDRKALGKLLFENPQLLKKQEELNKGSGKAVLYNCYHLYSHSGKYLGEMLEIEYLG